MMEGLGTITKEYVNLFRLYYVTVTVQVRHISL